MPLLPFLKDKRRDQVGVIVKQRAPDSPDQSEEDGQDDSALHAAAQDILRAISDNDSKHLALAIRAAFEICDSYPHEEGPHLNEDES